MNPANPLNLPERLPIARYRLSFALADELILPPYAGSTLRGAFGHALRRATCMTRQKECAGCPLIDTCPYSRIFATPPNDLLNKSQQQNPPQPYIIEAPAQEPRFHSAGSRYQFDLVLIGPARHQLALIAYAFNQAFEHGIGTTRARGTLADIAHETPSGYQSIYQKNQILPHSPEITLPQSYPQNIGLHFHTPLRLQQQGSILGIGRLNAQALLGHLQRRISTLATLYWQSIDTDYAALAAAAARVQDRRNLQWQDWIRYSSRQQRKMTLGGVIGTWCLYELPPPFSQLLYLGQWLHIGKETVFGHGRYTLKQVINLKKSAYSLAH